MAFPNITDIITAAIESRTKDVSDNVTKNNATLAFIKQSGNVRPVTGGSKILEAISFAENPNGAWYSGADVLPNAAADVLSAAEFVIKQLAATVTITGLEELQVSGKEQMLDLLDERLEVAESTLENMMNLAVYGDGTGSSGKTLVGLAAIAPVANATGTYGGIDRATWAMWRNKKRKGAGADFAGALDSTNIKVNMNNLFLQLQRGIDKPNVILADGVTYAAYEASLQDQQRFSSVSAAGAGFDAIKFKSADVIFDSTGIPANTMYFLNTKYLKLRPHVKRNFVSLDAQRSYNQDVKSNIMVWAGALTCNNPSLQGVLQS